MSEPMLYDPCDIHFDLAIVAVGFEARSRWVSQKYNINAKCKIGIEFGFLMEGSYFENRDFFANNGWQFISLGKSLDFESIKKVVENQLGLEGRCKVFIDISSMSREMMARIGLALSQVVGCGEIEIYASYAPADFYESNRAITIRHAAPIVPQLAGWSSRPDRPLGVVLGLGCEPGLAIGALQLLEPSKVWAFSPKGVDVRFDAAVNAANKNLSDIFDVTFFNYDVISPDVTKAKIESLLFSIESSFRVIFIPFGPKIFSWLILEVVLFGRRPNIGVWSFSSKESATVVDRSTRGEVIWTRATVQIPTP